MSDTEISTSPSQSGAGPLTAAERKKAEAEGDFKALEQQLIDRHKAELGAKDERIAKIMNALEKRLIEAELTKAITAQKGDASLLIPHARQFVKMRELDDVSAPGIPAYPQGFLENEAGMAVWKELRTRTRPAY